MTLGIKIEGTNTLGAVTSYRIDGNPHVTTVGVSSDEDAYGGHPEWQKAQGVVKTSLNLKEGKKEEVSELLKQSGVAVINQHPDDAGYERTGRSFCNLEIAPDQMGNALQTLGFDTDSVAIITHGIKHAQRQHHIFSEKLTTADAEKLAATDLNSPAAGERYASGETSGGIKFGVTQPATWSERVGDIVAGVMRRP